MKPDQAALAASFIPSLPLFAGLPAAFVPEIVAALEAKPISRGKVILMEQEISKTLYLLAQGTVSVARRAAGQKLSVATLQAPNFFGERSMFSEEAAMAQIKAESDCLLFLLPRAAFDGLAARHPEFALLVKLNLSGINAQRPAPQKKAE